MPAFTRQWLLDSGFAEVPKYWPAEPGDMLYRVFGEDKYMLGSCFSLEEPRCVTAAEFSANIVKWGNRCLYVAAFKVLKPIPMWIGRIDQNFSRHDEGVPVGPIVGGNPHAVQAWMERKYANRHNLELQEPVRRLLQDKTVVLNPNPKQSH